MLEDFLSESKSELITFFLEGSAKHGVATEEDGDLPLFLLFYLGEDFVPVRSPCVGPGLEARHKVSVVLFEIQIHGQLKEDRLHVGFLEGRGDVHVHI